MKKSHFLLACLTVSLLGACMAPAPKAPDPRPMPGGKSTANLTDPEVIKAAHFAASSIGKGPLKQIRAAETQVVAGRNYYLTIELQDGGVYEAVVYHNLQNQMSLTRAEKVG